MLMQPGEPRPNLVEYNADGTLTKETLKRAMKALKKRLKLHRLDDESRLGHDAMTHGERSTISAVKPPPRWRSSQSSASPQRSGPSTAGEPGTMGPAKGAGSAVLRVDSAMTKGLDSRPLLTMTGGRIVYEKK